MLTNTTKAKLRAGQTVFGAFVRQPAPSLVEYLGLQGWDFLVFDGEHGLVEPPTCEDMVRAAELVGVTPIARVPTNQQATILRFMDTGAQGVIVPWVNTAAEAENVVASVKYKPEGKRGLAGIRPSNYGQIHFAEYTKQANAETLVTVQIESGEAVENLPEIVKVPGVDVIFIGPTDLSQSLGHPGDPGHADVQAAINRVLEVVAPTSLAVGMMVPNPQAGREAAARGVRFVTISFENVIRLGSRSFLDTAKG